MLVPYSIVALLRSTYQILGHIGLSLFLSITQLLLLTAFVWGFSFINPVVLWWGFPSSAVFLLIVLVIYTFFIHHRNHEISAVTLIPDKEDSESLSISVKMDDKSIASAEKEVVDFLKKQTIEDLTVYKVRLDCEELMHNIVKHAITKKREQHYFDLRIRILKNTVIVLIKDDGRPFNPVFSGEDLKIDPDNPTERMGLKIVNATSSNITYKYMYDQNIVMLEFPR